LYSHWLVRNITYPFNYNIILLPRCFIREVKVIVIFNAVTTTLTYIRTIIIILLRCEKIYTLPPCSMSTVGNVQAVYESNWFNFTLNFYNNTGNAPQCSKTDGLGSKTFISKENDDSLIDCDNYTYVSMWIVYNIMS